MENQKKNKSKVNVKTSTGLVVSVQAVKKPNDASKVQELAAMEEALQKATDEAHKQRLALTGEADTASLTQTSSQTQALLELKKKQEAQQQELIKQLAEEEKQR